MCVCVGGEAVSHKKKEMLIRHCPSLALGPAVATALGTLLQDITSKDSAAAAKVRRCRLTSG